MNSLHQEKTLRDRDARSCITCLFCVMLSGTACRVDAQDKEKSTAPESSPELLKTGKPLMAPFVYTISPAEAAAALLATFDSVNDPLAPNSFLNKYTNRNDLYNIKQIINKTNGSTKTQSPIYELPSYVYDINGWKCDGGKANFHHIFALERGRGFKLSGNFIRSRSGDSQWTARVTSIRRLLTCSEFANLRGHDQAQQT